MAKTKPVSKKHYATQLKEENAAQAARIAELEAALANTDPVVSPAPARFDPDTVVPVTMKFVDEPEYRDDLDWIDDTVHSVWIVAKKMTITLRPTNTRVFPPIESIAVHAASTGPWLANPYDLRSNEANVDARAAKEKLNAVMYANWGFFCITRELAEDVYGDERMPIPKKAIVDSREFKGYDPTTRRSVGIFRPLGENPDPLRECVRTLLQRLHSTFIDASHHGDKIITRQFDPRLPNPYRRTLGNLAQKLPPVSREGATS